MGHKDNPDKPDSEDTLENVNGAQTPGGEKCSIKDNKSGSDDPTDGKNRYDWETCYPDEIRKEIYYEASYLFLLFVSAFSIIYFSWSGKISLILFLSTEQSPVFKKYAYYTMSGLLGGVVFAFKNLYKTVARGWWHQDRRLWRLLSPFVALVIGFIVGAMVESSLIFTNTPITNPATISIGFLSGYFADRAIGKMREIAAVVFGKSAALDDDGKQ